MSFVNEIFCILTVRFVIRTMSKVSPERAVYFTKMSVHLAYCWPLRPDANEWQKTRFDLLWSMSLISAGGLLVPLLYSIYANQSDSLVLTKTTCFLGAVSGFIIKIIVCRKHRKSIQALICEMDDFLRNAEPHERAVLQRYVDKCSFLHAAITFVNYLTTSFVICGPLLLPNEKLPTPAVYPFAVDDSRTMMYLVYAHQSFVGFQCSVGGTIDCQAALLMWYVGARLEIISANLETIHAADTRKLYEFIETHQKLLGYADQAKSTMAYIALTTAATSGISTVFSCLQLVGNQPVAVKMQFGPVALISIACLFVCAWPADNLIKVCDVLGTKAYDIPWYDMSPSMMKNILMIVRRSQRPVVASIGGFLPALSLRYYTSFLSAAFSYFTTLRITVNVDG